MTAVQWRRVKELLNACLELPPESRSGYLEKECGTETGVRREVEALLVAHELAGDFIEAPVLMPEAKGAEPLTGRTITHYRVEEQLGAGGMGEVYRAFDTRLDRPVAIKVISAGGGGDWTKNRLRFQREAKAASGLNHPNVVTVHDIDWLPETDPPVPFLVMELVSGHTLRDLIAAGPIPLTDVLRYSIQIADALAVAHAAGIVHRDIKPANIMVTGNGLVKILDFGLAQHMKRSEERATARTTVTIGGDASLSADTSLLTRPGQVAGTPAYLAPEQLEGRAADARSDVFSFGDVLYEMVSGQRPFQGDTVTELCFKIAHEDPPPVSGTARGVPRDLERIIGRCLRKDPESRFQRMSDVKLALEQVLSELEGGSRRRRILVAGIGAAAAVVLVFTLWYRASSVPTGPLTVRPMTTAAGIEEDAGFSPDGSQVVFSASGERGHDSDIYVMPTSGGAQRRLTTGPDADRAPVFSPDGEQVAFVRMPAGAVADSRECSPGAIWLVPASGGQERALVSGTVRQAGWMPSGNLVFSECESGGRHAVFTYSPASGERRQVTFPPSDTRGDVYFAMSHDGRWLALARWQLFASTDLLVMPISGGETRKLVRDNSRVDGITWSPDNKAVIYASSHDGRHRLARVPAASASEKPMPIDGIEPPAHKPAIHPGAKGRPARLLFDRPSRNLDVARYDWLGRAFNTGQPVLASTRRDSSPQFSPDGKKIVFSSDRSGITELWLADADGSSAAQLTHNLKEAGSPHWSPDGLWITFDAMEHGTKELYIISSAGGMARQLTYEPKAEDARPSFSADGKMIFYRSDLGGTRQIWRMPVEGGQAFQVTKNGGAEPLASPDGKWVYYVKNAASPGVWRVPTGGGEETVVLDSPSYGYWDVTARGIYYLDLSVNGPERPVMFYDVATRKRTRVATSWRDVDPRAPGFSVSRDGRSLLLLQLQSLESDVYLVDNIR